jgi:hypothetical protein
MPAIKFRPSAINVKVTSKSHHSFGPNPKAAVVATQAVVHKNKLRED